MPELKTEVQTLVKYLLENPNDIATFQENPQTVFKKLDLVVVNVEQVTQAIGLFQNMMDPDGYCGTRPRHHWNHADRGQHTDVVRRVELGAVVTNPIDFQINKEIRTDLSVKIADMIIGKETGLGRASDVLQQKITDTNIQKK
jgi:hypothetical protein